MKLWKAVLLIAFALAVAAAAYGLTIVRRGFSALAKPSGIEVFAATTARNLALPGAQTRRAKIRNLGYGVPSDFELNFGRYLPSFGRADDDATGQER